MRYIIVIVCTIVIIVLYKLAIGSLNLKKMNIFSYLFYSILFFEYIGISLAYLGFRNHYLIQKLSNLEIIDKTYYWSLYVIIMIPLVILFVTRVVFKFKKFEKIFNSNLMTKVDVTDKRYHNYVFYCVFILTLVSLFAIIYVFKNIGYVPLFKYFGSNLDLAVERIKISRNFVGNEYIKNLLMILLTPMLSYIAYVYMKVTKQTKWKLMFIILLIMSILVKTYDFSKAPIIYYFFYFYILDVMLGKTQKKGALKIFLLVLITSILIVIFYRVVFNNKDPLISLSNGPLARIIMTQAGTLLLHFEAFPTFVGFLNGKSFPKSIGILLGMDEYGIRSGRVLMEVYNNRAIISGTAGVYSTVFYGEAYANFGIVGLILSPILVGVVFSLVMCLYLKSKKTPLNIVLYIECFILYTTSLQAGFIDFIYNVSIIFVIAVILVLKFIPKIMLNIYKNKGRKEIQNGV